MLYDIFFLYHTIDSFLWKKQNGTLKNKRETEWTPTKISMETFTEEKEKYLKLKNKKGE